ncbi:LOW QUALITY PROTEIN: calcium uptake protein 3, mitochondrial [Thamnophis elegans]|uniref:LOW QUALITY PROTEIN: calcium uptake protein 3, mitochondrial n=1 Tax=Thamnophis elegans TaxID=35005 RepID=UPI0013772688|nr:LOW QUALITY PROTEIN: calcium uptake protein 3, mitochondrial [Thamnophis elegans]
MFPPSRLPLLSQHLPSPCHSADPAGSMAALRSLLGWRRCRLPPETTPRRPLWGLKAAGSGREGTSSGLSIAAAGAAGGALAWLVCYHYYDRRPHHSPSALGLGSRRERGETGLLSQGRGLQPIPVAAAAREIAATAGRPGHEDLELYATSRERRFLTFASLKSEGQLFMTPYDFIQSVSSDEPRQTKQWKTLSKQELNQILIETPPVWKGSSKLFRNLQERGIISYTEYLFLLCILTKPHAGFRIAFNMFDTDGNEMVDKKEFLVLQDIFRKKNEKKERKGDEEKRAMLRLQLYGYHSSTNVLKTAGEDLVPRSYWDTLRRSTSQALFSDLAEHADDFTSLHSDTTLLIHFFGKKGKAELNFEDFYRFMDNLQTEVLEIEFLSYSNGMTTISEEDFAHILLRYTNVENTSSYLENVRCSIPEEQGITFDEFRSFFQFLNNLEDFAIAMQMYNFANRSIGQDEFKRAVYVATGLKLSAHLVNTVFKIFDVDKDDQLSHKEFIGIMKDRLHRGFRGYKNIQKYTTFKSCMKKELNSRQ